MDDPLLDRRNSRQSIKTTDESDSFESICGYADEPLVSLLEACKPLINIVPAISTYVLIALNETSYEPADNLTYDESASIYLYTMEWKNPLESLETKLNQILSENNREELRPWFKYLKLFLTAVVKLPSIGSRVVWCVGPLNWSRNLIWWRISSTTTSLFNLKADVNSNENNEITLFSIQSINGRNIQQHSQYEKGKEVLLLPGSQFEVQFVLNSTENSQIVYLKQKIPEKKLLDPPFRDAILYPNVQFSKRSCSTTKNILTGITIFIILCLIGIAIGFLVDFNQKNGVVNWNGTDWANSCDFLGNDFFETSALPNSCREICKKLSQCSHFSWSFAKGGTCWLKKGTISKENAVFDPNSMKICGIIELRN